MNASEMKATGHVDAPSYVDAADGAPCNPTRMKAWLAPWVCGLVIAAWLTGIFPAFAAAAGQGRGDDPLGLVRATIDRIIALLQDPSLAGVERREERERRILGLVEHRFDFEAMARRALGAGWRRLDDDRKARFVELFTRLLETSYMRKIERYSGEKILYGEYRLRGGKAVVETFLVKDAIKTPVIYRLRRQGDDWRVYDVVIEGVSLVANYRTQFASILRKEGIDRLLERLESKIAALNKEKSAA